ncbi:molybdopterin-binding protein [Thermovenabulum gondwanense]|uniref:Molybdopterin molybdenumtransferase n=1 Tax=Thermovenabulum gondwanense TaxID=520767 RepID=A0A162MNQ3_9FIRM|nr:molybdopterin-binding protein [Thermovenabulum gondwanense]KYO66804.1 CinA-like protein [Thermovenabulum gondwanense]
MKILPVEKAVGMILCQDVTKIVPGEFKGRAFKKGHIIKEEDIQELLKLGKEHVYVWEAREGEIHEDEAAIRIARSVSGENVVFDEPYEGKSSLKSAIKGLLKVDQELLYEINSVDLVTVASLPDNFTVEEGQKIAGARVIPLVIDEEIIKKVEMICSERKIFNVKPYRKMKAGIITTGSEVYKGRIKDRFGPIMIKKLEYFGAEFLGQIFCPDDVNLIIKGINEMLEKNAEVVILTGGMSVDADDLTPKAIKECSEHVVTYGAPVQPGNMFMLAYRGNSALLGVPGCAMYHRTTILDAILPRIFIGERLKKEDFIKMGLGGLCQGCEVCRYPNCYFCR